MGPELHIRRYYHFRDSTVWIDMSALQSSGAFFTPPVGPQDQSLDQHLGNAQRIRWIPPFLGCMAHLRNRRCGIQHGCQRNSKAEWRYSSACSTVVCFFFFGAETDSTHSLCLQLRWLMSSLPAPMGPYPHINRSTWIDHSETEK